MGAIGESAAAAGIQAGGTLVGTGLGMATAGWNDKRQIRQQKKLNALQIQGEKEMSDYNAMKSLDIWEKTNYAAQRQQLEKAGLNVGLMYGKGGSGGTTVGAQQGTVQGAQAPSGGGEVGMGMQLGSIVTMQVQKTKAEIELLKAEENKTNVEAAKLGGVDTQKGLAEIRSITVQTDNAETQGKILEFNKEMSRIQADIANKTEHEIIDQYRMNNQKLQASVEIEKNNKKISDETYQEIIKQAAQTTVQNALTQALTKANISNVQIDTIVSKMSNARAEGNQELDMSKFDFSQDQWYQQLDQNDKNRVMDIVKSVLRIVKFIK